MRPLFALALSFPLAACTTTPSGFTVSLGAEVIATPSGAGILPERRPSNCDVEFFRLRPPDRSFDEVATLHFTSQGWRPGAGGPAAAQDLMRAKACSLGAHAVVVTRDYVSDNAGGLMTGTAIAYRGHRARDAGLPDPPRVPAVPMGLMPKCSEPHPVLAKISQATELRDGPRGGSFLLLLDRDAVVCAAPARNGNWRSVDTAGRIGWVQDGVVVTLPPPKAAAPVPASPAAKPAPVPVPGAI